VIETPLLEGRRVRLEPMTLEHLPALETIGLDPRMWRYMTVWITTPTELRASVEKALQLQSEGTTLPWVTVLKGENGAADRVVGSTRLMDYDRLHRTAELGYTWLTPEVQGTGVNREAKLLQLTYAFEVLALRRVAFKTHHENLQSQAALEALGATYEGTFRNHVVMPDGNQRHSRWYSITREEWPTVRSRLEARLQGPAGPPASA
jgi:RimJ/RimL family protein N-acetyltransferase